VGIYSVAKSKKQKKIKHKAGVVVYRVEQSPEPEILLISGRKYPGSWVFPVGTVEPGETLQQTAARECLEESGYVVDIGAKIETVKVSRKNAQFDYTFFLAYIRDEVKKYESDRKRKWVPLHELRHTLADIFLPVARVLAEMNRSTDIYSPL
jgi:8-oxo-dGTP pyrophosphatase MutT (NUDIX family)